MDGLRELNDGFGIKMTMRYAHYSPEHLQKAIMGFELGLLEPNHILTTAFEKRTEASNISEFRIG
jgi:hypothetical protein